MSDRARRRLSASAVHVGLVIAAAGFLAPLIFMFVAAVKPDAAVIPEAGTLKAFVPSKLDSNYADAVERADFGRLFRNSLIVTIPIVAGSLIVNSLAGYGLARLPFRGRRTLLVAIIALAVIPFQAIAIPLLYVMADLQWLDTYHVQILPFVASPFFIYFFATYFEGLPRELEEAARLDGAGPLRIFATIIVPLSRPAYATVSILAFLISWGELLWPVLVTRGPEVRPLPLGMSEFQNLPPVQWGDIMAFAGLVTVPLLILFVIFQRSFVRGVASTAVKG